MNIYVTMLSEVCWKKLRAKPDSRLPNWPSFTFSMRRRKYLVGKGFVIKRPLRSSHLDTFASSRISASMSRRSAADSSISCSSCQKKRKPPSHGSIDDNAASTPMQYEHSYSLPREIIWMSITTLVAAITLKLNTITGISFPPRTFRVFIRTSNWTWYARFPFQFKPLTWGPLWQTKQVYRVCINTHGASE